MDSDVIKKVLAGVAIAAISGSITWSYSIGSRTSVLEAKLDNTYQDILQTQERLETNRKKVSIVEDKVLQIFNEMKIIQMKQVNIMETQTNQMSYFQDSLEAVRRDVEYLRSMQLEQENKEKNI